MKDVPYIDFNINDLRLLDNKLVVGVNNVSISLGGELKKEVKLFKEEQNEEEVREAEERGKTEDLYTVGREKVSEKLPERVKKYSDYIFVIPDIAALLTRLLKDNRVSIKTKLIISGSIAYIVGPEGGFSKEEVELASQNGFKVVSLGKRILRAETAAIYLASIIGDVYQ